MIVMVSYFIHHAAACMWLDCVNRTYGMKDPCVLNSHPWTEFFILYTVMKLKLASYTTLACTASYKTLQSVNCTPTNMYTGIVLCSTNYVPLIDPL